MGKKKTSSDGGQLPRSVKTLSKSRKDWAKKNGLDYKDSKANKKIAKDEYALEFVEGLDRAMEIILHSRPDSDLAVKVKKRIEDALARPKRMAEAAEIYSKNRKQYPNIIYLPNIITTTIGYLHENPGELTDREKAIADNIDETALVEFCETILKKPIAHYSSYGLTPSAAMSLASLIPSAKILNDPYWYRALIPVLYGMSITDSFSIETIFDAVTSVDKDKVLRKRDMKRKFWLEFILMKNSNRFKNLSDNEKSFHETLQSKALEYMNDLGEDDLEAFLYKYIGRRIKSAEKSSDGRRIFRFVDHANSNSPYTNIKKAVEKIISSKPTYEEYLK